MISTPLKTPDVTLFPTTVLYLRVVAKAVDVVTTQGTVRIESSRPRFLIRDVMGGMIGEITAGMTVGNPPMDYVIRSCTVARRHSPYPLDLAFSPENVPLPKRVILFETSTFGDYQPFDSLEVVGIKRNGNLIFGFADTTYELTFPAASNARETYRSAVDFATDPRGHFSSRVRGEYLDTLEWVCGKRTHCDEIAEVHHRPECWGRSVEILDDFRGEPEHVTFRARVPPDSGGGVITL